MTSDAASGREGLWTEPKFPGDTVRVLEVIRAGVRGSIRIDSFTSYPRVGMFLPGVCRSSPRVEKSFTGGEPEVWPEKHQDTTASPEADNAFDRYVQEAYAAGWQNYYAPGEYVHRYHVCHDGVRTELNAMDCCDRCGVDTGENNG